MPGLWQDDAAPPAGHFARVHEPELLRQHAALAAPARGVKRPAGRSTLDGGPLATFDLGFAAAHAPPASFRRICVSARSSKTDGGRLPQKSPWKSPLRTFPTPCPTASRPRLVTWLMP